MGVRVYKSETDVEPTVIGDTEEGWFEVRFPDHPLLNEWANSGEDLSTEYQEFNDAFTI